MDSQLESLYRNALMDEYGFNIPQLPELIEVSKWVVEDLNLDTNDEYALETLVHLAARSYKFGFDEGIDVG